jgi:hypothetical protein
MNALVKFYTILIAVTFMGISARPACSQPVMEHELNIQIKPSTHWLQASDEVTVTQADEPYLGFSLASHLRLDSLTLDGQSVRYTYKNGWIRVPWTRSDNGRRLRIVYSGRFDDGAPEEPLNSDNPGYGVSGVIGPQGTMLLAGAGWYPMAHSGRSVYRILVDAPEGVVAVTSGKPLGHHTEDGRTLSRWRVDQPVRGIALVAGNYTVSTRRFGNVTAATYFTAPLQHLSDNYLEAAGGYLELYQEMFGPYAFEQFAVVENFFPTGYGFPGFTLMGRRVLQLPFIIHTSLGHEIAHCWWGNGVLVDPSQGNWSEGLTTYVADYLYQERRGQGRAYRLQWLRNYADLVNPSNDFAASRFTSRVDPATKAVGYDKVAMVFHMLRQAVGDKVFWATLRDIYTRHRFEAISWPDFQAAFETRSNRSLERFFRQWVYRPGAPRLSLAHVTATPTAAGYEIRGSVFQDKPFYDLNLDLAVTTTQRGETLHAVKVTGARTPFSINIGPQPQALTADPEVHLLRQLHPSEMPPTINAIKGAPSVLVVLADHLDPQGDRIAGRLAAALGLNNARIGKEKNITLRHLQRNDLLIIGNPSDRRLRPGNDAQFAVTPQAFMLNGDGYDRQTSSFFGVFVNPHNKDRTVAIFIPASASVAKVLSTKIPHYGKYSYLVFNDSRNQVKGIWAVDRSPMVVKWTGDSSSS